MLTSRNGEPSNGRDKKKRKKVIAITASIMCAFIAVIIVLIMVIIPKKKMNKAMTLLDAGNYDPAYALLDETGNHETVASSKYERAEKLIDSGDYESAYMLLNGLAYKDSDQKLQSIIPQYRQILMEKANAGNAIFFGSCEQDNNTSNGKEGIEWIVLAKEKGKALVISKYALECLKYDDSFSDATWETCSLRSWLNETFLNNTFTAAEQELLVMANVTADENPLSSENAENATNDKVFILNITEAKDYFGNDESRICAPTAYAKAHGAYTTNRSKTARDEAACWWWLRTPGKNQKGITYVTNYGDIDALGSAANYTNYTVRPVLWIDLDFN